MNQTNHMNQPDQAGDEINLIDLIYPIYKRRKFLILFCVIIVIGVGLWTRKMPKTYEATAVILPESKTEEGRMGSDLKAAFMEQFGIAGLGGSAPASSELFEAVLKSNELARCVLRRYHYFYMVGIDEKSEKLAAQAFARSVKVVKSRNEPIISIGIQSHDPLMASDIANTYLEELDKYNRTKTITSARRLREYIEKRLVTETKELTDAQKELRAFQEENKAISISKQTEATLAVLSELEAQRVALEVEKAAKEKFYRGPHIEIEQLKAQMEALQKNIDQLTYSEEPEVPVESEKGKVAFYIPLTRIPALNFDESRLLLKVKVMTGVVTMLVTQLEQAQLDEAKDMPTVTVLDRAEPPNMPIKPRLKLNVILGGVIALFVGILFIFFMEFIERTDQDPETSPKVQEMKKGLLGILFFRKSKRGGQG